MGMILGRINEETPAHTVLSSHGTWEVRQYPSMVCATVASGPDGDRAFGVLARYIGVFGTPQNAAASPLAMTAPVLSSRPLPQAISMTAPVLSSRGGTAITQRDGTSVAADGDAMAMSFVLPSSIGSVAEAPVPTNPRVVLEEIPPRVFAVKTFSGNVDDATAQREEATLRAAVVAEADDATVSGGSANHAWSLVPGGGAMLARYNPPFTLWFLKTNEVMVEVEQKKAAAAPAGAGEL